METAEHAIAWAAERLGYQFRRPELLIEALTHPTYAHEAQVPTRSNQRLEFLGDAVLGLVVASLLFARLPDADEGMLTKTMQGLVASPPLSRVARRLGLGEYLRLGRGEEGSGGRQRTSNLADAFEAVVAAVFLDGGFTVAAEVIRRVLQEETEAVRQGAISRNYKSMLQEWAQERLNVTPTYRVLAALGPEHDRRFQVEVLVAGKPMGHGEGRSKREAEQAAARVALSTVGK